MHHLHREVARGIVVREGPQLQQRTEEAFIGCTLALADVLQALRHQLASETLASEQRARLLEQVSILPATGKRGNISTFLKAALQPVSWVPASSLQ
jgi:hypothetical protein